MKLKARGLMPTVNWDQSTYSDRYAKFTMDPLDRGFGTTLGNALRRVLLSSIPGAAITSILIQDVPHEFSTVPGLKEDVVELVLNIKKMWVKSFSDYPQKLFLDVKGPKTIYARDFLVNPEIEILNPELLLGTLAEDGCLKIEMEIQQGKGYVPAEMLKKPQAPQGTIFLDGLFSPVSNAVYSVEHTRVEQDVELDKLNFEVYTDGSITPDDAVGYAAKTLKDHLQLLINFDEKPKEIIEEEFDEEKEHIKKILKMSVDELELSVRSCNCLKAANIHTIGELVQKTEAEMLKYRNFGRKSLTELNSILSDMGLYFGMNLSSYLDEDEIAQLSSPTISEDE